jgi:hypothetical protein
MTAVHNPPILPRPQIPTTDFPRLRNEVGRGTFRQALPQALSDEWLLCLTRDLLLVERALHAGDDSASGDAVSGPLLLGLHLLLGRTRELNRDRNPSLQLDPARVSPWLQTLQAFCERELVRRVTGLPVDPQDTVSLIAEIDAELKHLLTSR